MLIMWGALVFSGYIGSFLLPRQAGYFWAALNLMGVAGSFAISAFGYRKTGIRTFDFRMLIAFVLFFAFGFLCTSVLGHFTPRQIGTFWPIYFMLLYIIAGLLVRPRLCRDRSLHQRAGASGLFLGRRLVRPLDGLCRRRRARSLAACGCAGADMTGLDDIIHQPLRLRIMAALNALPPGAGLEFARLKKLTGATDGNLGAHIETLSKAGYVAVEKAFVGKKPQTTVTATSAGRGAFARHVAMLQEIIAAAGGK